METDPLSNRNPGSHPQFPEGPSPGGSSTLIRGGRMVVGGSVVEGDLLIQGERVAAVGDRIHGDADTTIDARGLLVLPGGVDTHVHFNDVFMGTVSVHDYFTGTRAAAFGGTTP